MLSTRIIRILLLDIETAPNIATVWGLFKQNIGINQLLDSGYVLCWSAKWLNFPTIIYSSVNNTTPLDMLQTIHDLLDEADAVIHYNGTLY